MVIKFNNGEEAAAPPPSEVQCDTLNVIKEEVEFQDGCPVLPKMMAWNIGRSQCAVLEKTLRDGNGNPIDLTTCINNCQVSASESVSEDDEFCGIKVRFMEITGYNLSAAPAEAEAAIIDATNGVIQVTVPAAVYNCPGVYKMECGVFNEGCLLFSNTGLLIVDAGLYGWGTGEAGNLDTRMYGPPSIQEIRLTIRDNAPSENVLLDDVEFSDVEIGYAMVRPIRQFNEVPPPLSIVWDTTTFPWKEHWIYGIQGNLYNMAEAWYRRNRLGASAGGIAVDDLNKEREYMRASELMLEKYTKWMTHKKVEINAARFVGSVGSSYG